MTAAPPCVSVVIPTYRRPKELERCLRAVLVQRLSRPFEVIVVDDGCSPETAAIVVAAGAAAPGVPVTLVPGRGGGPAVARNQGWRRARGEVVAFIDDDASPRDEDWLAAGCRHFERAAVLGVSGRVVVPLPERPTDFQRNVAGLEGGVFLTCNAFYRRAALEAVGGFDERFRLPFREDTDLQFRVEGLGGELLREPAAVVVHPAPPGRFAQSLRLQKYAMYNALLYAKHPRRYRETVQPRPPLRYYATCAAALAALAAAPRRRGAAAACAGLWLALTADFYARRQRGAAPTPRHRADMALTSVAIPPLSVYWRLRGAWRFRTLFI